MCGYQSGRWYERAPRALMEPHTRVIAAIRALTEFQWEVRHIPTKCPEFDVAEEASLLGLTVEDVRAARLKKTEDDARSTLATWAKILATQWVSLRDAASHARKYLSDVEEEFGAVAGGVVEFQGHSACSYHALAIRLAWLTYTGLRQLMGPDDVSQDEDDVLTFVDGLDTEDVIPWIESTAENDPDLLQNAMLDECEIEWRDADRLVVQLQQELFRAWKRKYPDDGSTYETWRDDSGLFKTFDTLRERRRRRPAYKRDHLWLKWQQEDGLTPAGIRDMWNAMTDDQRRAVCAGAWQRVESTGGKEGERDIIKKGIQQATRERTQDGQT